MDIKAEIHRLKMELKRDQDPTKMGRIQRQIGVSCLGKNATVVPS
jgi:hypothetical protein